MWRTSSEVGAPKVKVAFGTGFNGLRRQEIVEEIVGLGSYGKVLTVLTGMEPPDEFEDEETDLEESWEVRFRR